MTTLYGKPDCAHCERTERYLTRNTIPFTKVDVSQDPDGFAHIKQLGYMSIPVVVDKDRHWSGYDPEKLALCPK